MDAAEELGFKPNTLRVWLGKLGLNWGCSIPDQPV